MDNKTLIDRNDIQYHDTTINEFTSYKVIVGAYRHDSALYLTFDDGTSLMIGTNEKMVVIGKEGEQLYAF
jgi:hypothetical protein